MLPGFGAPEMRAFVPLFANYSARVSIAYRLRSSRGLIYPFVFSSVTNGRMLSSVPQSSRRCSMSQDGFREPFLMPSVKASRLYT